MAAGDYSESPVKFPTPLDRLDAHWPKYPCCLSARLSVIGGRAHLSLLQPIGPGEELLVWYTVEDNPEITAALEEERASSLSRKNSPRAKRGEAFHRTTLSFVLGFSLRCECCTHAALVRGFIPSQLMRSCVEQAS